MSSSKAFTLVELIVVITILAILGTIAFISLQGYSKEARDSKRLTDVRNLVGKISIENTKGTSYSDLITKINPINLIIDGTGATSNIGVANFEKLKEQESNFKDPLNEKQDYPIAYAIGGTGSGAYAFVQAATINEVKREAVLVGRYYQMQPGDAPSLFKSGALEITDGGNILPYNPDDERDNDNDNDGEENNIVKGLEVNGVDLVYVDTGDNAILQGMGTHGLQWYSHYITQESISYMKNLNMNFIRPALYTLEDGYIDGNRAKMKSELIRIVDLAIKNNMYVLIDWHILKDYDPNMYKSEAIAFFDEISKKYADVPNVLYEIANEPNNGVTWPTIKSYAEEVIPIIRKNSQNAVIIVGTPNWSSEPDKVIGNELTFANIMYTYHYYASEGNSSNAINYVDGVRNSGLPIFITEWSTANDRQVGVYLQDSKEWLDYLKQKNISWANWCFAQRILNINSGFLNSSYTLGDNIDAHLSITGRFLKNYMLTGEIGDVGEGEKICINTETPTDTQFFTYDNNGTIEINGYDETNGPKNIIIPCEIDGALVTSIRWWSLNGKGLTSVVIPATVTNIGEGAFNNNPLTSINIPNGITNINNYVFGNTQLSDISIPNSVTNIGEYAFESANLNSINIPNSVTNISTGAFKNNNIQTLTIPGSVNIIGEGAFQKNDIKTLIIQNGVQNIGVYAFNENSLTSITIPDSIQVIGNRAFNDQNNSTGNGKVYAPTNFCNTIYSPNLNNSFDKSKITSCTQ